MAVRVNRQDVVKSVLDANAVDFAAIGRILAEMGPTLSMADEPWESFCLTMKFFVRLYVIGPPIGFPGGMNPIPDFDQMREAAGGLNS